MTPSEFKAWFGGFVEAMDGTPSEAQWQRIKARVAEIDGRAITEHVYINRYMPSYPPYYGYWNGFGGPLYYGGTTTIPCGASGGSLSLSGTSGNSYTVNGNGNGIATTPTFDSHHAMLALGRAEAQGMNS